MVAAHAGIHTGLEFFRHGIAHILTGYDHLLFVVALLLGVRGFWDLIKIVSAFTLAHTVTLTLSAFDVVRLPEMLVESMIAGSIVVVAIRNLVQPHRGRDTVLVVFLFGLFHGLGFAGAVLESIAGLGADRRGRGDLVVRRGGRGRASARDHSRLRGAGIHKEMGRRVRQPRPALQPLRLGRDPRIRSVLSRHRVPVGSCPGLRGPRAVDVRLPDEGRGREPPWGRRPTCRLGLSSGRKRLPAGPAETGWETCPTARISGRSVQPSGPACWVRNCGPY